MGRNSLAENFNPLVDKAPVVVNNGHFVETSVSDMVESRLTHSPPLPAAVLGVERVRRMGSTVHAELALLDGEVSPDSPEPDESPQSPESERPPQLPSADRPETVTGLSRCLGAAFAEEETQLMS